MSTHTEYTGHVGPVVEGKKYLSTNKPPRVFTADIYDVGIGKIRFVIDSEREVEDPEPEHPTAELIRITAVSDGVNEKCVGQIGQRDPKDGTYRAHVGNHLACIDGGEVA